MHASQLLCLQVVFCFFLSIAWGANSGHITMLIFEMVRVIHESGTVPATVGLPLGLRCATAAGMAVGTLLWGARLTPVTGMAH